MRTRAALTTTTVVVGLALAGPLATAARSAPPVTGWTSVDLGTLGGQRTEARDVNSRGQVVGQSQTADGTFHAFLWQDGVMTDLTPGAAQSAAYAVNDRGTVVGHVQLAPGEPMQAARWSAGTMTLVAGQEFALEVDERGRVAGTGPDPADPWTTSPFLSTAGGTTSVGPVPFPETWPSSSLVDLNAHGTLLGRTEGYDDREISYVWRQGVLTRVGAAGGRFLAVDLNDRGHVVGQASDGASPWGAVLWRDGQTVPLGVLPGGTWSSPTAVNEHDVVVGWTQLPGLDTARRAFVWRDGVLRPIVTDAGVTSEARAVNDRGQIAGQIGYQGAGGTRVERAFAWDRGTLTRLGGEHRAVVVTDQSARGHVLVNEYDEGVRARLHVPPRHRS